MKKNLTYLKIFLSKTNSKNSKIIWIFKKLIEFFLIERNIEI